MNSPVDVTELQGELKHEPEVSKRTMWHSPCPEELRRAARGDFSPAGCVLLPANPEEVGADRGEDDNRRRPTGAPCWHARQRHSETVSVRCRGRILLSVENFVS